VSIAALMFAAAASTASMRPAARSRLNSSEVL